MKGQRLPSGGEAEVFAASAGRAAVDSAADLRASVATLFGIPAEQVLVVVRADRSRPRIEIRVLP